jgi:tRNA pseudouridine38-40 synthase
MSTGGEGPSRRTLRLVVEYDGRRFEGWHGAREARTVSAELGAALEQALGERQALHAAAATDPGVHAEAQAVSLRTGSTEPARRLHAGLEARLPGDLAVHEVRDAADGFHARHGALRVTWRFHLALRRSPLHRGRSWLVDEPVDRRRLERATARVRGELDLSGFADRRLARTGKAGAVIESAAWQEHGPLLVLTIRGLGLACRTCRTLRRLIGALVAVGRGSVAPDDFERRLAGAAPPSRQGGTLVAPPPGLVLAGAEYPPELLEAPLDGGMTGATAQRAVEALRREARSR